MSQPATVNVGTVSQGPNQGASQGPEGNGQANKGQPTGNAGAARQPAHGSTQSGGDPISKLTPEQREALPERREAVSRDAIARNSPKNRNQPHPKAMFRVSLEAKDDKGEPRTFTRDVEAISEEEAWAMFCDEVKRWPNPKHCNRKIERLASPAAA